MWVVYTHTLTFWGFSHTSHIRIDGCAKCERAAVVGKNPLTVGPLVALETLAKRTKLKMMIL